MGLRERRPAQVLEDAAAERAAGLRPLLLDVREPWECATAAVTDPLFEHLNLPLGQLPVGATRLESDRPVYVLCHHGVRSLQGALFLRSLGFETVCNVEGGIDAWSRELDPSIRTY